MKRYITALSIAGSDPSGGAGLQADLKTFSALGVYGATAITAVTVQNTVGVKYVHALPPQVVYDQIVTVMEDIMPDAVKIGMVNDAETLDAIVRALTLHRPRFLVVDPVMVATSGCALMQADALQVMEERLLPMADIVTPNLPEAWTLAGTDRSVDEAAQAILRLGVKALLIKGGHAEGTTKTDYLYVSNDDGVKRTEFSSATVDTFNTHGTGCTLSSAIAAMLARGHGMEEAVRQAKMYLTEALKAGADVVVGHGHGPVCHFFSQQVNKQTSRQGDLLSSRQADKQTSRQGDLHTSQQVNEFFSQQVNKQTSRRGDLLSSRQANKQTSRQGDLFFFLYGLHPYIIIYTYNANLLVCSSLVCLLTNQISLSACILSACQLFNKEVRVPRSLNSRSCVSG